MANPHKGEASLKVGGADYTLVFDINALCEVEDLLDLNIDQIIGNLGSVRVLRGLIWGGLRAKHPDVTLAQAGDIVEELGLAVSMSVVGAGLKASMPKAKEGAPADPRNGAAGGTGRRSKRSGSKPV